MKPVESTQDFKARITALMRLRETDKAYSVVGAARSHGCVVRKPTDPGYYPPSRPTKKAAK